MESSQILRLESKIYIGYKGSGHQSDMYIAYLFQLMLLLSNITSNGSGVTVGGLVTVTKEMILTVNLQHVIKNHIVISNNFHIYI